MKKILFYAFFLFMIAVIMKAPFWQRQNISKELKKKFLFW